MRLLLIEDEKEIVGFLKPGLERAGFAVDVAEDGERGEHLAKTNPYDLAIVDITLPKKHGDAVCRSLRAQGIATPFLVLSAMADPKKKAEVLNAGADDYLAKPFSFEELLARVRALMRRPKGIREERLEVGPLVLDRTKHAVHREGTQIHLTPKEFDLLEYMMRNRGTAVSRGMMLEHVWDMAADPFSNTIESHIASLRKKVDGDAPLKLIHTVRGVGYRLDDEDGRA